MCLVKGGVDGVQFTPLQPKRGVKRAPRILATYQFCRPVFGVLPPSCKDRLLPRRDGPDTLTWQRKKVTRICAYVSTDGRGTPRSSVRNLHAVPGRCRDLEHGQRPDTRWSGKGACLIRPNDDPTEGRNGSAWNVVLFLWVVCKYCTVKRGGKRILKSGKERPERIFPQVRSHRVDR